MPAQVGTNWFIMSSSGGIPGDSLPRLQGARLAPRAEGALPTGRLDGWEPSRGSAPCQPGSHTCIAPIPVGQLLELFYSKAGAPGAASPTHVDSYRRIGIRGRS